MSSSTVGYIRIGASVNLNPLDKGLKGGEARLAAFSKSVTSLNSGFAAVGAAAAGLGGALAIGAGVGEFKSLVTSGAQLNAVLSKTRVIFGDASGDIIGEADKMAAKFGTVKREYIDAAASFGAIFKELGKSQSDAAALGNQLAKLGMDMASFEGVSNAEAFGAITSALKGEMDPIERFRVLLNADKVAAEALAMGLAKTKGEISDSAKKMATMSLILKQTSDAQGDLARTSGEADNQLKSVAGTAQNMQAEFGLAFQPATESVLRLINSGIRVLTTELDINKAAVGEWAATASAAGGEIDQGFEAAGNVMGVVANAIQLVGLGIDYVSMEITALEGHLVYLGREAGKLWDSFFASFGNFPSFFGSAEEGFTDWTDTIDSIFGSADEQYKKLQANWAKPWKSEGIDRFAKDTLAGARQVAQAGPEAGKAAAKSGAGAKEATKGFAELTSKLKESTATFGMSSQEADIYKLKLAGASDEEIKLAKSLQSRLNAMELAKDTESPLEAYQRDLKKVNDAAANGGLSKAQTNEALVKSQQELLKGLQDEASRYADFQTPLQRYQAQVAAIGEAAKASALTQFGADKMVAKQKGELISSLLQVDDAMADLMTPGERFRKQQDQITAAVKAGAISQVAGNRLIKKSKEELISANQQELQSVAALEAGTSEAYSQFLKNRQNAKGPDVALPSAIGADEAAIKKRREAFRSVAPEMNLWDGSDKASAKRLNGAAGEGGNVALPNPARGVRPDSEASRQTKLLERIVQLLETSGRTATTKPVTIAAAPAF